MDITQFAQLGVASMAVYLMYKIASNHIDHNTKVLGDLRDAIRELSTFLKNQK